MKVLNIVLNNFINDSRVLKTSRTLASRGFSVTVIALHEPGLATTDLVDEIHIDRVVLKTRNWSKAKFVQLIKYFEFVLKVLLKYPDANYIHCNDLSTLPIGFMYKLLGRRVKIVYDAHEYETETLNLKGLRKRASKLLERALIKFADEVITVSDSIAGEYSRLYSIPKPSLVLNCPPYKEVDREDLFRKSLKISDEKKIFLYQGGFTDGRGIQILLEAFESIESDDFVLVCMGYGPLDKLVKDFEQRCKRIIYFPAVKPDVLLNYTASADFGILFYEDTCLNHRYCSPNKIFEYLMAGLPVITSNLFEMARLVNTHEIGVVASSNDKNGLLEAILNIQNKKYGDLVENVHKARKIYSWENQEIKIIEIYSKLSDEKILKKVGVHD